MSSQSNNVMVIIRSNEIMKRRIAELTAAYADAENSYREYKRRVRVRNNKKETKS